MEEERMRGEKREAQRKRRKGARQRTQFTQEKDQQEAQAVETVVEQEKPADVGNLTHALVMTEISDPLSRELFKKRGYDTALMAEITQFQVHLNDSGLPLKRVNFGLDELRHEPRFSYKTKVFVKFANGIRLESTSVDFSARGLRILLPKAMETQPLEVVQLAFPLLQQITKKLDLNHLDYRIVGTRNDQKTLYLRAVTIEGIVHHGVKFF